MNTNEIEIEVARLVERIEELRDLQRGQRHLPFIVTHIEEYIEKLRRRLDELRKVGNC